MNVRQMVFPLPQGEATLAIPEGMSEETLAILEQASALVFRALRPGAPAAQRDDVAAAEYDSWAAGAAEYESWRSAR